MERAGAVRWSLFGFEDDVRPPLRQSWSIRFHAATVARCLRLRKTHDPRTCYSEVTSAS